MGGKNLLDSSKDTHKDLKSSSTALLYSHVSHSLQCLALLAHLGLNERWCRSNSAEQSFPPKEAADAASSPFSVFCNN